MHFVVFLTLTVNLTTVSSVPCSYASRNRVSSTHLLWGVQQLFQRQWNGILVHDHGHSIESSQELGPPEEVLPGLVPQPDLLMVECTPRYTIWRLEGDPLDEDYERPISVKSAARPK